MKQSTNGKTQKTANGFKFKSPLVFAITLGGVFFLNSCCSFVIPPVTLTGNKTAIEKQIIGEQNELEKDVWMISSAKTAGKVEDQSKDPKATQDQKLKTEENRYTNEAFLIMDVYAEKLAKLKADKVVGEDNKGYVASLIENETVRKSLSKEILEKYNPQFEDDMEKGKDYRTLKETVAQINIARDLIIQGYMANQQRAGSKKIKKEEVGIIQKNKFHEASLKGEYIQDASGNWSQKN